MKKRCALKLLLLISLGLLAPSPFLHADTRPSRPLSPRLYRVSARDKKSGELRFGFIDKNGKLVIAFDRLPAGVYVDEFSEGLAVICSTRADGACLSYGFIDETGKVVIEPRLKRAQRFSEGLAYAQTDEGTGFIDHRGQMVIRLKQEMAREFHEGLAAVTMRQGRAWGYIDRTGKLITKQEYTRAENFSEGLAAVAVRLGSSAKYGFINKEGDVVIPLNFDPPIGRHRSIQYLGRFSDGLARVQVGNRYGYIDRRGEFIINPRFIRADDFSEGLARVLTDDYKLAYIDKAGRQVISLNSAGGTDFKEGLAAVAVETEKGRKWGYIDGAGKFVIEARFDSALEFVDGVAQVYMEESVVAGSSRSLITKLGYIDRTGKYIWPPQ